ncbi:MAG: hypothetical protein CMP10_09350 [Zetaproteobacteria bacterium]|nr:hypothetical protein [Pseudobdellovibrionaceae bacterium]
MIKVLRFFSLIPVFTCLAGSLVMFCYGIMKTWNGAATFIGYGDHDVTQLTSHVIGAMDTFLVAIVLLIFAGGIFELFYDEQHTSRLIPQWLKVDSIGHLKHLLVEVIILVLSVQFLEMVTSQSGEMDWRMMILPLSVLCLSVSLKVLNLKK